MYVGATPPLQREECSVLREATKVMKMDIKNMKIAIQGFGNAGMFAFELSQQLGAKVVAVSDSKGGIYSERGLDSKKLAAAKPKTGSVQGYGERAPRRSRTKSSSSSESTCSYLRLLRTR